MRLRLVPVVLAAVLAIFASSARADVFSVVPAGPALPGLIPAYPVLPAPASLSVPPASPVQLSYPQLLGLWQRAGAQYGIPWQVLAAINKIESNFGRNMGPSSAGAIGWMQFMPSTWMEWGFDADGDGVADPWNPTDAIFSAARYLAANGGGSDLSRAVFAYNHADWYVREVLQLAALYGSDGTIAFSLDRVQLGLDSARQDVVDANAALVAAERTLRGDRRLAAARQDAVAGAVLLSDRLARQKQATLAALRADATARTVARARRTLARARTRLRDAQRASTPIEFNAAASNVLGGPEYSAGYVFPVGGGAAQVHVSHTHHDYPAADIAAPLGSPEYALADSTVLRAWSYPDPKCGIGMTIRAFDGQVWTYCHMSALDARVVPGAHLSAGQEVGLVGMTGDATGPHLHLQLQPATGWPQQEAWFQSFAGTAFSWDDAEPDRSDPTRTIFAVGAPAQQRVFAVVADAPAPAGGVVLFNRP